MTKGAKIALGCAGAGCLVVGGIGAMLAVGIGVGGQWLKGKAEALVGHEQKIEALKKRANAHAFTQPTDGVVTEDRLLAFLDVRRRVFTVYEKHRPEFEALSNKKEPALSDITAAVSVLGEVRLALAQAMADVGMSEGEYQFMVQSVYQSAWASAVQKDSGKPASQAVEEAARQLGEAMEKGMQTARKEGVPGTADVTEESIREAQEQLAKAAESARQLDAPPANIELFRKHEAEIKKYSMNGMELLGL